MYLMTSLTLLGQTQKLMRAKCRGFKDVSLNLRFKDLLGPVTRVKKKKKKCQGRGRSLVRRMCASIQILVLTVLCSESLDIADIADIADAKCRDFADAAAGWSGACAPPSRSSLLLILYSRYRSEKVLEPHRAF